MSKFVPKKVVELIEESIEEGNFKLHRDSTIASSYSIIHMDCIIRDKIYYVVITSDLTSIFARYFGSINGVLIDPKDAKKLIKVYKTVVDNKTKQSREASYTKLLRNLGVEDE